jgi:hypothetical protein
MLVRLAVLRDRLDKALLVHEHSTKTVVGVQVLRIDVEGLLELVGGFFVVLL